MLSVRLICVGKLGEKFWADAVKEYTKRLGAYCTLEIIELPEQRLPQTPSEGEIAQALEKEAALIESKLLPGASVIAMCVEGKPMSSEQLADYFGKLTVSGTSKICVLIGGSCGLSERVKKKAALRLSMSPMTFPHPLARVMVLEQMYRALNIAAGGKYHKCEEGQHDKRTARGDRRGAAARRSLFCAAVPSAAGTAERAAKAEAAAKDRQNALSDVRR